MCIVQERIEIQNFIDAYIVEMNRDYIGKAQEESTEFTFSIPITNNDIRKENIALLIQEENKQLDLECFQPESEEVLESKGKAIVEEISTGEENILGEEELMSSKVMDRVTTNAVRLNPKSYNRVVARDYARRYAGVPGTMSNQGYNSNYRSYNPNDCANFVSQCLVAGGLETNSSWKPYTITWVNTGHSSQYYGLSEYMADSGAFFKSSDKGKAFAGSIVVWTDQSHVGIVDQNDGVTMTFCAHTKNRKSSSFKSMSNIRFLIPVWDSYTGKWTQK